MAPDKAKKKTNKDIVVDMMQRKAGATAAQIASRLNIKETSARSMISRITSVEVSTSKSSGGQTVYKA